MAGFISKMYASYQLTNSYVSPLTMAVPTNTSEAEKQDLLNSFHIAGVQARLVDESTALVYAYANENIAELRALENEDIKTVVFFDMGYSNTSLTLVKFCKDPADG